MKSVFFICAVATALCSTAVYACTTNCITMDPIGSDDSCLTCPACGVCESSGVTTHCKQPGTVHLTIDDGPFDTTGVALDILKFKNVKATFFLLGVQIFGRENYLKRMVAEGHNIGSHSWDHPHFNSNLVNISKQITDTNKEILRALNKTSIAKEFRPPFGECNKPCMTYLQSNGWKTRLWNLDTMDYLDSMPLLTTAVDSTMAGFDLATNAWIVGMHLKSNLGLCALPVIIDRIRARGYTFVTAEQCWGATSNQPIPGFTAPVRPIGNDFPPAVCTPQPFEPQPLVYGSCGQSITVTDDTGVTQSVQVGCRSPKSCCSQFGFCGNGTACGSTCKTGFCDSCQQFITQAPTGPNAQPNTPWPACTVDSPLFINACTSVANGGCSSPGTKECVMTGSASRNCSCNPGWTGTTCQTDVNECAVNNGGCHPTASECTNTVGSRNCSPCHAGYTGTDGINCVPINECATGNGGCNSMTTCIDLLPVAPGWVFSTCGSCPSGFSGSGLTTCVNINECLSSNGGCSLSPLVSCTDQTPVFGDPNPVMRLCGACPSGYTLNVATNQCVDVNECAVSNGGCSSLVSCWNTAGSFKCQSGIDCGGEAPTVPCSACPPGYTGTGIGANGCTDINECQTNRGGCHDASECENTAGSFSCGACKTGLIGNGIGPNGCSNVNECANENGGCVLPTPVCDDVTPALANGWQTRRCSACGVGFNGIPGACVDIDEWYVRPAAQQVIRLWCQLGVCECSASDNGGCSTHPYVKCYNTPGSMYCGAGTSCPTPTSCSVCPDGFTAQGKQCIDINECLTGGCALGVTCTNTFGANLCGACPDGMDGNGFQCININECMVGNSGCTANERCIDMSPHPDQWIKFQCVPLSSYGVCAANPCLNGGVCKPVDDSKFSCACPLGWTGATCDAVAPAESESSSSLSAGQLSSMVVPAVVGGAIVVGVVALCCFRRRNANAAAQPAATTAKTDKPAPNTAAPAPAPTTAPSSPAPIAVTVPQSPELKSNAAPPLPTAARATISEAVAPDAPSLVVPKSPEPKSNV